MNEYFLAKWQKEIKLTAKQRKIKEVQQQQNKNDWINTQKANAKRISAQKKIKCVCNKTKWAFKMERRK